MRAERVVTTPFESAPGTSPSRRTTRTSARVERRCRLLVILASTLAFLALAGPATPREEIANRSPTNVDVSAQDPSADERFTPDVPVLAEQDTTSFDGSAVDAAAFLTTSFVLSLTLLYWLFMIQAADLRPGITSQLLVPG